jgi:hypothetical protein
VIDLFAAQPKYFESSKIIKQEEKFMIKNEGKGIGFQRIRRVTGYLSGDVKFMNNAKRAEVAQRVKHIGNQCRNDNIAKI